MKNRKILGMITVVLVAYGIMMPGCGSNNNQAPTSSYYNCQPGQVCTASNYTAAAGIPLISTPSVSALDPQGLSYILLTYAAPAIQAGQAYSGPVNISGVLHLAPGACVGPMYNGGDIQISGQGNWINGPAFPQVQGVLQAVSGGIGGSVTIMPPGALIQPLVPPINSVSYTLTKGPGIQASFCSVPFAFFN